MKRSLLFVMVITLFFSFPSKLFSQKVEKGERQITNELLKEYIDFLASDSLLGRRAPGKDLDLAADYIVAQFEKFKLGKINGSYFQTVPFYSQNLDTKNSFLKISGNNTSKEYQLKTDFIPFEMTLSGSARAEIVFAGYGITAPEYNYDDYSGLDVKGKIVLVLKHEPGENDTTSVFEGKKETKYSSLATKLENAKKHGASGFLLVNDPLNHMMLKPQGYPWPSLSKLLPQDNLPIQLDARDGSEIPIVQVGENVIKQLFGSVDSLKKIQISIDKTLKPNSFQLAGFNCDLSTKLIFKEYTSKNVVGLIKGTDEKIGDELVVIGGHYDHVGYNKEHKDGEDYIYNGADDNASGTAGVMSIAKAFTSMKQKPRRSVLFILFTAEEMGLYGSAYYSIHPLLPLDKTVAMLNLDMIGRNGDDTLNIEGASINPDLTTLILKENEKVGLKYVPSGEEMFGRSDHYNFFVKGISGVDITSGLHKDYHTVRDNPNTINHTKVTRISRLIFRTTWSIANDNKYFTILKNK